MNAGLQLRPVTMGLPIIYWSSVDGASRQASLSNERLELADHLKW